MKPAILGLRGRLLLLVLLAVIPAFVLIGYTAYQQRQQVAAEVDEQVLSIVRSAAREQRQLISTTRQLLMSMAQLPAVVPNSSRVHVCSDILSMLRKPNPYYTNFGVARPDGELFCSALPMHKAVNITDRSYFQRALESRDLGIGEYQIGRLTEEPAINFGYPVTNVDGEIVSVVFAALNLSWLEEMISNVELPDGASLMVIDNLGTLLARYPETGRAGESVRGEAVFQAVKRRDSETALTLQNKAGESVLYAVSPLHYSTSGRIYISIGIPAEMAFAGVNQYLYNSARLLLLVVLLVFAAAWFGGDILVLRRIRALKSAAEKLAAGDMSARSGLPRGSEELGQLAATFDDMAGTLQRTDRALRTLSAGNHAVVRATDEAGLLRALCDNIVTSGGYQSAWVGYRDEQNPRQVQLRVLAPQEDGVPADEQDPLDLLGSIEQDDNPVRSVIEQGEPFVCRELGHDPRMTPWRVMAEDLRINALVLFPLQVNHRIIGILGISSSDPDAFDTNEISLLEEAAEDLAYGIRTLRMSVAHEQAHATISHMAYYDSLTDLPNHSLFDEHLQTRIDKAQPTILLFIDLDRFREVNEAIGFHRGDSLLRDVGERINYFLPAEMLLARMRGNEFAVLVPGEKAGVVEKTIRDILAALDKPFNVNDLTLDVSVTIGVVRYPEHGSEVPVLIRRAETAVRQARNASESVAEYKPEDEELGQRRLSLATQLRYAIEQNELVLHYHPKIDLPTEKLCGVEALVRWDHPREGMIPPNQFIPLAEETGLIKPLTDWVLKAAMCQSTTWRWNNLRLPISVNLSARNLYDRHLVEKIEHMLSVCDTDVSLINLELTESALMINPDKSIETLHKLHERGFSLFIDDFGTGYSSLSYLQKMAVSVLKIDKSFVQAMLSGPDSLTIVSSTIAMAHDLGLKVVAEGVENEATWNRLKTLDCDVAQGYYITRPLPLAEFEAWLDESAYSTGFRRS
ncbi:bifunctional diguanylate cyclase/phosphodiesterase [Thiohalophilus thiocyanatoxydans]|uniref:cyclic-guanylate-specific phosphodiesterase n=1 Tax=Thiohalophilus thiocyanatoxydans TaxID=381308 RepID=A0A4R8ILR8_9GAMM|nr:EAL domain-containing protein [Thiohalophilus thiocyanatoxydans]TDY00010.1 diguanylate cyclase (GGDEF)-like protein [Thiohalophilus thiocyanatoxydans]